MRLVRLLQLFCVIFVVTLAMQPRDALGQAMPVATKGLEIEAFGSGGVVRPDYGDVDQPMDHSFLLGGDIAVPFHFLPVTPALEIRANIASGTDVNEKTYGAGLRLQRDFGRITPYLNGTFGLGTIHFNDHPSGYTGDRSKVYAGGLGVKVGVTRYFSGMVDFQYQSWNLGQGPGVQAPVRLHPLGASVGIVYRIPFRGPRGQPKNEDLAH